MVKSASRSGQLKDILTKWGAKVADVSVFVGGKLEVVAATKREADRIEGLLKAAGYTTICRIGHADHILLMQAA